MSSNPPETGRGKQFSPSFIRFILLIAALGLIGYAYRLATLPAPAPPVQIQSPVKWDLKKWSKHEEWN